LKKKESEYRQTIPKLIKEHKKMIGELLRVMGAKIGTDLSDDKMHNVIKSKKMAAETTEWSSKEIDRLEEELAADPTKQEKVVSNFAERLAQ